MQEAVTENLTWKIVKKRSGDSSLLDIPVWFNHYRTLCTLLVFPWNIWSHQDPTQRFIQWVTVIRWDIHIHIGLDDFLISGSKNKVRKEDVKETLHLNNRESHANAWLYTFKRQCQHGQKNQHKNEPEGQRRMWECWRIVQVGQRPLPASHPIDQGCNDA